MLKLTYWSLVIYATLFSTCLAGEAVLLFGTSCAGKSTLAHALTEQLGPDWDRFDWDEIADEVGEDHATEMLLSQVLHCLDNGRSALVDCQPIAEWPTLSGYRVTPLLIYAPLPVLVERDQIRSQRLNRSTQRQRHARAYIYHTFCQLYGLESNSNQVYVDSIHRCDLEPHILEYPLEESTKDFLAAILAQEAASHIYSNIFATDVIRTDIMNLDHSVKAILSILQVNCRDTATTIDVE